ncbi:MAG: CvpA family protein [Clostridiales bacterium]|nr:CvpA family protein [Clostridiales bacterium]
MGITWLGVVALVILAVSCVRGFRRGLIREVVSALFVVLALGIVSLINPYVNEFLKENTSVYEMVQSGCESFVENQLNGETVLDSTEQANLIDTLNLPDLLTNGLSENNTVEVYSYLAVSSFSEYVSGYLAVVIMNALSFLLSYLLSSILIKTAVYALDIFARLPVIHGVNKLAGAAVGFLKCILLIWVALLVLTVLCNTTIGKTGLELVEKDTLLSFLYNQNIFAKFFTGIFYGN